MTIFTQYIRWILLTTSIFFMISLVCWFFLPTYRPYLAAYSLGATVSILNGLIIAVKTVKTADYALGKTRKLQGTGKLQRYLLAGFAGYTIIRYPLYFHWAGLVLGVSTVTILSLCIGVVFYLMKRWD